MNESFWKNKKVLVTGHTGFKGSWFTIWLESMGAEVIGFSLDPITQRDNFVLSNIKDKIMDIRGDIRDQQKLDEVFKKYKPEIIFHFAAQPLVRLSYEQPKETYEVNVMGTLNVLETMRQSEAAKVGVFITTDKCYENKEQLWSYREIDPLGGYDPYSSSKGCAEILISSYRNSFMNPKEYKKHGKGVASVRAGNVIGGGDWSCDRIVPDCIRAIEKDTPITLRNPNAVRPWQHVLEPLSGYLLLAEKMYQEPTKYDQAWNFGPYLTSIVNVGEIAKLMVKEIGKGEIKIEPDPKQPHEANLLLLDITKAKTLLNWAPKMEIDETIKLTCGWYKRYQTENVYDICTQQIREYMS